MRIGVALFVAMLLIGCYDRFDDAPKSATPNVVSANVTLKYLDQLLGGREYLDVTSECVVQGRVVAADVGGNFYRSFVMQDSCIGVEVLEGLTNSAVRHPLGSTVAISMKGLRLSRYNSVLQIGVAAEAGSYIPTTYMAHELIIDRHVTTCAMGDEVEPQSITLTELMYGSSGCYGSLVRFDDVVLVADSAEVVVWSGWLEFKDRDGRRFRCHTSSYADYAGQIVPRDTLSLVGILQSGRVGDSSVDHVVLKMRNLNDCVIRVGE